MHNFKPQNGLYPGSGVAPGGQLGRPTHVHGGVTGARPGGHTPNASQLRPLERPGMKPDFLPSRPAIQVQVPRPALPPQAAAQLASLLGARPLEHPGMKPGLVEQNASLIPEFHGPRTFKDSKGNVRPTVAWQAHLAKYGLHPVITEKG